MSSYWIAPVLAVLVAVGVGVVAWRKSVSPAVGEKPVVVAAPSKVAVAYPDPPVLPSPAPASIPVASPVMVGSDPRETTPERTSVPASPASNPTAEVQLIRMPDGASLVDQLYIVRGQGTAADPYVVTWDMLLSASETFAPADGRWEVPQRLKWLDGKQLQIKGFLTSPTRANKSDHLLLTWSAQDACCNGVPANPCQTVEVKLESPITLETHVMIGVTVEGTFKVHPRMAGGLRMSLFHLENARVVALGGR